MFCPQCGKKDTEGGKFCAHCGSPLPAAGGPGGGVQRKGDHETIHRPAQAGFTKGKARNFWGFIGLSIVTLGIYFYYWYFINIKELRGAFPSRGNSPAERARILYYAMIVMSIVTTAAIAGTVPDIIADPENAAVILNDARRSPGQTGINILSTAVYIAFLYYYTRTVSMVQSRAGLGPMKMKNLLAQAITGALLLFLGGYVDTAGLAGGIVMLVYLYSIQGEINRIWIEG